MNIVQNQQPFVQAPARGMLLHCGAERVTREQLFQVATETEELKCRWDEIGGLRPEIWEMFSACKEFKDCHRRIPPVAPVRIQVSRQTLLFPLTIQYGDAQRLWTDEIEDAHRYTVTVHYQGKSWTVTGESYRFAPHAD